LSATSLWSRDGDAVVPSVFSRGPWDPTLLHGGAVGALVAELGQELMDADITPVRLTVDLIKPVPLQPITLSTEVLRTGRRLQLIEVGLRFGGALVAQATLLALRPLAFDDKGMNPPVAAPVDTPEDGGTGSWSVDPDAESFVGGGQEFRFLPPARLGEGVGWFRLRRPVLDDDREPSPLARAAAAADVGGAVSARRGEGSFPDVSFVNADISVHLGRLPEGEWIRLASRSRWEASGIGSVDSELGDAGGPFGSANQALVLERRTTG
jgi:hypothetical protein